MLQDQSMDTPDPADATAPAGADATEARAAAEATGKPNATAAPATVSSLAGISMKTDTKRRKTIAHTAIKQEREDDLLAYWERLCEGRPYPAIRQLDEKRMSFYPHPGD